MSCRPLLVLAAITVGLMIAVNVPAAAPKPPTLACGASTRGAFHCAPDLASWTCMREETGAYRWRQLEGKCSLTAPAFNVVNPLASYDLGTAARTWECAKLPPTDFKRVARVYCTDAEGQLVTLRVEAVSPKVVP